MSEIEKLIEYAEIAGHDLSPNGDKLKVRNGTNLPPQLKRLLHLYKDEILEAMR